MVSLLATSQILQAKMYRWVDDNGNTYYSDKIPPEFNKLRHEYLNDKARVVEVEEAEKPKEQKLLEQRLAKLRQEREKVIAERELQDKVLLTTFRSEEDIRYAMQRQLAVVEAKRKVSEGNLTRFRAQLQMQQKKAASYELDGNKVPEKLLADISATQAQVELINAEIEGFMQEKRQIKQAFDKDADRFLFLTKKRDQSRRANGDERNEPISTAALGLYTCVDEQQCIRAWDMARMFVRYYSSTDIELDSDQLVMAAEPLTDEDLSLSLAKINNGGGESQIFLDIRCRASQQGDALCKSAKVNSIRSAFTPFIQAKLAAHQ